MTDPTKAIKDALEAGPTEGRWIIDTKDPQSSTHKMHMGDLVPAHSPVPAGHVAWVVRKPGGYSDVGYESRVLNKLEHGTLLYASPHQVAVPLTDEQIEALAHRIAWRYKKSSDPHHSDTYTFNRDTLIQFAAEIGKEKSK